VRTFDFLARSGVAPQLLSLLHPGRAGSQLAKAGKPPKALAVTDDGNQAVEVLNSSYVVASTITAGMDYPDGDWYDAKGNLYVANYDGLNVNEYPKGASQPSFSYSRGLIDPVNVTTDSAGNVYVADYGSFTPSFVAVYPQGSNRGTACNTGLANEGVAIDASGNVFVSGIDTTTSQGQIVEFQGGISGCTPTTLGVTLGFAGGIQVDKKGNLVVCDQYAGADIIKPPYTSVSSTIGGACFHDALNKASNVLFLTPSTDDSVLVMDYPSGASITTLSGNGLNQPIGVATYPFAK
jgi:hypothetical protein